MLYDLFGYHIFRCVQIRYKMSFKDARDALVLYHDNEVIDDEEFCLLYDANRKIVANSSSSSFNYLLIINF